MKPTPVDISDDFQLMNCNVQNVSKLSPESSIYYLDYMKQKEMNLGSYRQAAMVPIYPDNLKYDQIQQLFWQNLDELATIRPIPEKRVPIYATDNEFTRFPGDFQWFNLGAMTFKHSILHGSCKMPGVNTPYVYYSMPFTSFALHHEDSNVASISIHHEGAAKTWYSVPSSNAMKLEEVVRHWTPKSIYCDTFIKHKTVLIPPEILRENNIDFAVVNIHSNIQTLYCARIK